MIGSRSPSLPASQVLLSAALCGLLGASLACRTDKPSEAPESGGDDATVGGEEASATVPSDASSAGDSSAPPPSPDSGDDATASTPPGDDSGSDVAAPPFQCDGGVFADAGVTSSMTVTNMTLATFTSQCDMLYGVVEIIPECRGSNSCRGMSYDSGTETLTQHTCRATNTCAGYSCVVCG